MIFTAEGAEKPTMTYEELLRADLRVRVMRNHLDTIREHKVEGCWLNRGYAACPLCPDCVYCGKVHR